MRLVDGQKGCNHSVIIAVGAAGGIVARRVLVGSNERRFTRRDYVLRSDVASAVLTSANAAGVDRRRPHYLLKDNASVHRGAVFRCRSDCTWPVSRPSCQVRIRSSLSIDISRKSHRSGHQEQIVGDN